MRAENRFALFLIVELLNLTFERELATGGT